MVQLVLVLFQFYLFGFPGTVPILSWRMVFDGYCVDVEISMQGKQGFPCDVVY